MNLIQENQRRLALLPPEVDPLIGDPADPSRTKVRTPWSLYDLWLPNSMLSDPQYHTLDSKAQFTELRHRHDFEFWAATCAKIRHKLSGQEVPFILNAPQRRVVRVLEQDRLAGRPLRLVLLKARQWGGSTLVQMYFAWIQTIHRRSWHSVICAQQKDTSQAIRAMYDLMLRNYPDQWWQGDDKPALRPWQGARNICEIAGRDCRITVTSSFRPDSVRGQVFSMAHLSEVAFWKDSPRMRPVDFIRSVCGGIPSQPYSMIVLESTANGMGNFFHTEWLRASSGQSGYRAVFVPWYEIEQYRTECPDPQALFDSLTPYERALWDRGLTLEMIQWYHNKRADFSSDEAMWAEYPSTASEAFANTGTNVFSAADIDRLRADCRPPLALDYSSPILAASGILDLPSADGELKIWELPPQLPSSRFFDTSSPSRYVAAVDIGGRSRRSDYSVIVVMDRSGLRPRVVAQWRGHADHDLLGAYAARLGRFYHFARLVIESNSLESASDGASQFILEDLNQTYPNLYVRRIRDRSTAAESYDSRVGFHTNRSTKSLIITALISMVRSAGYIERDIQACNELATYEQLPDGSCAARQGHHDDLVMSRAIALYVCRSLDADTLDADTLSFFSAPVPRHFYRHLPQ